MRTAMLISFLGCVLLGQVASAENLTIPGHKAAQGQQIMPRRGIKMEAVLKDFGEPSERRGPIGEPPITEWVYGSFRVYFENQTVLHAINMDTLIMPK